MIEKLKELSGLLRDSKTWMEHVCKECDGADMTQQAALRSKYPATDRG